MRIIVLISLKKTFVLDCSTLLPGPYCTMMLAELGANVVKIERPDGGDLMRKIFPGCYSYLNGNKKSVTLNFKKSKGRELFLKLATKAHVVVEGFRPGVTAGLGIDFDSVKKANPSIIYCSISGYGESGPYATIPGHDINYQGLTGLFSISGSPKSRPEFPYGFQVADIAGSMFALVSILAALQTPIEERSSAIHLDVSLTESLAMWMMPRFLEYVSMGKPSKEGFMGRGPYGIFETRDGQYLTLGIVEDHFWINLCNALGFYDLASDENLNSWSLRNMNRDKIVPRLKSVIKEKDLDHWIETLSKANIPVAPVMNFDNWMDNPQFRKRSFLPITEQGHVDMDNLRRFPVQTLARRQKDSPKELKLGRDTVIILKKIGVESDVITKLKSEGVI